MSLWRVPRIWQGGTCWIIGGGPSIAQQFEVPEDLIKKVYDREVPISVYSPYLSELHNRHTIAINSAFLIGDWIDLVFFGDRGWFFENRHKVAEFTGLKVTCSGHLRKPQYQKENIKFVGKDRTRPKGISRHPSLVSWNLNSGAAAISVAAHMGVKRIVLLGFDMKLGSDHRQHFHSEYGTRGSRLNAKKLPFDRHLKGFHFIKIHAKKMGIEIINASPDSSITEFRKMSVKEVIEYVDNE